MKDQNLSPLLQVRGLKKYFPITGGVIFDRITGWVKALDGIDISVDAQDIVGLVGESGSGKSTLGKVLLLLEAPTEGEVFFEGSNIFHLKQKREIKNIRRKIQAIFQDPFSSLSPRMKVERIIAEPLMFTAKISKRERDDRVAHALHMVGLPEGTAGVFPHELSGGQRQRVAIARAISSDAKFIILDEPTSALDVSIRLQIVELLLELQEKFGLSYLLIGHDLGMVTYMANKIAVMYLGKIVEFAETGKFLENTLHPYSRALISASLPDHPRDQRDRLTLVGEIANPIHVPKGCRFHPRCLEKKSLCREIDPPLKIIGENHWVACHL